MLSSLSRRRKLLVLTLLAAHQRELVLDEGVVDDVDVAHGSGKAWRRCLLFF
jgi:hypothetical protein